MSMKRATERSLAEWEGLVDEWRSSGQTQAGFARSHGINPRTFQGRVWKSQKMQGLAVRSNVVPNRFVEVESPHVPAEPTGTSGCRITMSKTEIEFASSAQADWAFQILSKLGHGK